MEIGRFGIRCNAIRPYAIGPGVAEYNEQSVPWRRLMDLTMGSSSRTTDPDEVHPSRIAPMVVWLCSSAANEVNGRTFLVSGDGVSLLAEPRPKATISRPGGWTLDALDEAAPEELVAGLTNRFTLSDHPDLQIFEE
jgi:hypothetical protein